MVANLQQRSETETSLRQVFASVTSSCCPRSLNFHLHTLYSDGKMEPEELVKQAISLQVAHFAITDHHTVEGYHIARHYLTRQVENAHGPCPTLWVGVEINASLLFTEVHILGYDFDPELDVIQPYLQGKAIAGIDYQAVRVIEAIHRAGGIAILAHPARYRRSPEDLIPAAAALGIDGIETYYGYDHSDPWRPSPKQTASIRELGDRYGLLHTCGTDSHGSKITRRL